MQVEDILAGLQGVTKSGERSWMARCPAHDDRTPSLSIKEAADGKVLLHCFGGCSQEAVVAAGGWTMKDLFADASHKLGRTEVAHYDYTDEDGTPLFQVVRFAPKDFRQRCRDGAGGWKWSLKGVRRVLYHLPAVLKAAAAGGVVFITEGEKDADRLVSLGLTATCNAGGAGKWKPAYSDALAGAHVVILPDNDDAGWAHAEHVARSVSGTAKSVKVVELPNLPPKGDVSTWLGAGHGPRELLQLVKETASWTPRAEVASTERPVIAVREELNAVTNEAVAALDARPDLNIYVRARLLVTISRDGSARDRWLTRPPGSPVIVPIEEPRMLALLDEAATWEKHTRRGAVPAKPPTWVAKQVLGRLEWSFPYLEGVVETPTLRADGTILASPGWDEATGLLYDPPPGVAWPPIPQTPTAHEVSSAKARLLDPVGDFPFVAPSDRSAYLAALLTLMARHLIDGPVPMFVLRAPTPGTGKTLLASVLGLIGTGREPAVMAATTDEEEWRKVLLTLALDGTPLILLDNISGSLGSDALALALTAREIEGRILGATKKVRAPLVATWLATGNNLGFKRTLARRVVPIDLDAGVEAPEDRTTFKYPDLVPHVRAHRAEFVAAALTLLRAFHVAGRPVHGGPRMGSFESWDDLVRSAVMWLGLEDPASTDDVGRGRGRMRAQADDDVAEAGELLAALHEHFGDRVWWTARKAVQAAQVGNPDGDLDARRPSLVLRDALNAAAPNNRGPATTASLGYKLRSLSGRPIGGLQLEMRPVAGRAAQWMVRRV